MFARTIRLVTKDFRILRHEWTFVFVFVVMALIGGVVARVNPWMMLFFGLFTTLTYISHTFNYDYQGADRFCASLPVRRSEIVASRYGGTLLVALSQLALFYLINLLEALILPHLVKPLSGEFAGYYLLFYALLVGVSLPVYFRLGVMKARFVVVFLYVLPATLIGALLGSRGIGGFPGPQWTTALPAHLPAGAPIAALLLALLLMAVSLPLSVRFFRRRDL